MWDDEIIDFGKRLHELRKMKGASAREMSLSLGASESYINRIETGRMLPSMEGFFRICSYLKVGPDEFFDVGKGIDLPDPIWLGYSDRLERLRPDLKFVVYQVIDAFSEISELNPDDE